LRCGRVAKLPAGARFSTPRPQAEEPAADEEGEEGEEEEEEEAPAVRMNHSAARAMCSCPTPGAPPPAIAHRAHPAAAARGAAAAQRGCESDVARREADERGPAVLSVAEQEARRRHQEEG